MSILKKISAFASKAIEVQIEGQTFKFYPPRLRNVLGGSMAKTIEPIAKAVQAAFFSNDEDAASRQYERDEEGRVRSSFIQGVPTDTLALRERQKSVALESLVRVIWSEETRYQIGILLADSLREEFSEKEAERAKEARQFIDEISPEQFIAFLKGYIQVLLPILNSSGNSMFSGLYETVRAEVGRQLDRAGVPPAPGSNPPAPGSKLRAVPKAEEKQDSQE